MKTSTMPPPPPPSAASNVTSLRKLTLAPDLVISAEELAGKPIGIFGTTGSGKTTTVRRFFEQALKNKMAFTIVDIENEYAALKEVGEVILAGPKNEYGDFTLDTVLTNEKQCYALGRRAYLHDLCVVLLLSEMDDSMRKMFIGAYLAGVFEAASNPQTRRPHWIGLEEAQEYIPQVGLAKDDPLRLMILRVSKRGRKRGMFLIPMSQRPASVDKDVLTQCKIFIGHAVEFPNDIAYYKSIFRIDNLEAHIAAMKPGDAIFRMGKTEKVVTITKPVTASPSETPGAVHVENFVKVEAAETLQREIDQVEDREGTSVVPTGYLRELEEAVPRMKTLVEQANSQISALETRIAELEAAIPKDGPSADLYAQVVDLTRRLEAEKLARNDAEKLAAPITMLLDILEETRKKGQK